MPQDINTFFGEKPKLERHRRKVLGIADVPASTDGLRALAASGNWSAVQNLSAKLAHQSRDPQTGRRETEPYLQLALVQVTALVQKEQYAEALECIERVGDMDGAAYNDTRGRSLVPFSLRFLHAAVPQYVGKADTAAQRLTSLLARVEKEQAALAQLPSDQPGVDADDVTRLCVDGGAPATRAMTVIELQQRSEHRRRRITRAMAVLALERGDVELGLYYLRQLADSATTVVDTVFLLQQVGCAALRSGDFNAAQSAFDAVKQELASLQDDECATEDEEEVVEAAVTINTALVDTFCGRFNEAVKRLHELAAPALSAAPESPKGGPAAGVPPGSMLAAEMLRQNNESKRTGRLPALLTMQLLAANTFIVLHQYVTGSERCTIPNSVASFEGLLRRYPVEASRMLPTVMNLRRIYEWHTTSGQHQRRSMLEAVVDAYTVERDALPKWARAGN